MNTWIRRKPWDIDCSQQSWSGRGLKSKAYALAIRICQVDSGFHPVRFSNKETKCLLQWLHGYCFTYFRINSPELPAVSEITRISGISGIIAPDNLDGNTCERHPHIYVFQGELAEFQRRTDLALNPTGDAVILVFGPQLEAVHVILQQSCIELAQYSANCTITGSNGLPLLCAGWCILQNPENQVVIGDASFEGDHTAQDGSALRSCDSRFRRCLVTTGRTWIKDDYLRHIRDNAAKTVIGRQLHIIGAGDVKGELEGFANRILTIIGPGEGERIAVRIRSRRREGNIRIYRSFIRAAGINLRFIVRCRVGNGNDLFEDAHRPLIISDRQPYGIVARTGVQVADHGAGGGNSVAEIPFPGGERPSFRVVRTCAVKGQVVPEERFNDKCGHRGFIWRRDDDLDRHRIRTAIAVIDGKGDFIGTDSVKGEAYLHAV